MNAEETITAIDADGHILEHVSDVQRYLEGKSKGRRTPLWPGCQPWDSSLGDTIGHPYEYFGNLTAGEQVALWHRILEENHIEKAVLFSTGSGSVPKLQETDFAIDACRAVNNHFAEDYADDRLFPVGVLPMRTPDAAVDELRRASQELGLRAFEIMPTGLPIALGNSIYHPLYAEAERLGVVISVHGTRHWAHEVGAGTLGTFSEVHCYAFTAAMLLQFTSVMANGIAVKFPKLKMSFLEIGASWLPYYLDRLDEHWEKRGKVDMPLLTQAPSEVFRNSLYKVSVEGGEKTLSTAIDYCGAAHFMFATDVPHWDCECPHNLNELREMTELSPETRKKIIYDNAKEFYGF